MKSRVAMIYHLVVWAIVVVLVCTAAPVRTLAQMQKAKIVSCDGLRYPATLTAGDKERVTLGLTVAPDGTIRDIEILSGYPLLSNTTQEAVREWRFDSDTSTEPRYVRLNVDFGEVSESEDEMEGARIRYDGSDTITVTYVLSTIRRLPRVNGEIPARSCPVHDELMHVEILPIRYGLSVVISYIDPDEQVKWERLQEAFARAQEKTFPEANRSVLGGCLIQVEKRSEVYYCETCRANEARWFEEHPDYLYRR